MAPTVFISHSSDDAKVARTICAALERRGLSCWMASRDVGPGQNYMETIVRAIRDAKVMVLVFSQNANISNEILKELSLASKYKLNVIPARIEDVVPSEAFELEFATRQWIDLFNNWEEEIERLTAWIVRIVEIDPKTGPGESRVGESVRLDTAKPKHRADEHERPSSSDAALRSAERDFDGPKPGARPWSRQRTLLIAGGLIAALILTVGIWRIAGPSPPKPEPSGPYGALATSPRADFGYSYNFASAEAASPRALSECAKHASDCTVKRTFENTCVSIAKASNGAMGWAWGNGKADDDRMAMESCNKNNGGDCQLATRFCTGSGT